MEFEDTIMDHDDGVQEDDGEDDPPEIEGPIMCCYCGRNVPAEEQSFDCDSCPHNTCVDCRFADNAECILCKPSSETQAEPASLKDLYSTYFSRKRVNKDHIVDVELSTEEGSVQKQMCNICERVFKRSNARYHYACASGEKPHSCVECGQKFMKKSHLESHLNKHYGVRPFKCSEPKCKASFTQKDKLIRHVKSHNKETKLMCPLCDKLYTSQDILNNHMIKVHSSTKQFRCDQCPRTYKYQNSLRNHQLKHQAKRDYMCEICGKKYALSTQLKLHKRSHILYHRRPFKCRCGRRFMSRRDKARHELIHTSCHDFECSLCNTTFGRKDNLERHMKNFHREDPPVLKKNGKLVATVAPFNSKHIALLKENGILMKKEGGRAKINKIYKQNVKIKDKPKTKSKPNVVKETKSKSSNLSKSTKISKGNFNLKVMKTQQEVLNTSDNPNSKLCDKEPNHKQSVIVSLKQSIPQNRPSVIKSIPNLLPYRILPPDKRFLKLTDNLSEGQDHSDTQAQTASSNNSSHTQTVTLQNQNNSLPTQDNYDKLSEATLRIFEDSPASGNVRRSIPKDDALNRCFRIIRQTGAKIRPECTENIPSKNTALENNVGPLMKSFDGKLYSFRSRKQITLSPAVVTSRNASLLQIRQSSSIINSVRHVEMTNNTTNSNVGGPSLLATLSDSVSEINHEDNFTGTSMGEATYSSYTPYFDSEYFRDSMNSYDSSVENLLPHDLDVGFQYISEQLGCSEMTLASESRIIRYVSQETRVVKES